jgi:4-diphosphocytidyl-2-C-methyl-D-erythritol kinase
MTAARVRAFAKINLSLRVLGVRPDGYHELRTVFQTLAMHDTLAFELTPGPFSIVADDPACPTDSTNLVWRAASSLWSAAGRRGDLEGVSVRIRKQIPAQAGLGGGSSDAASTLLALRALWKIDASDSDLESIARTLGADVACFLKGGTVLGLGRGDLLFLLEDADPEWVVVARPDFGVSTRDAYAWWDEAHAAGTWSSEKSVAASAPEGPETVNDLEAPVCLRHPGITRLIKRLQRLGARRAAMSGSGSAVFGLFPDRRSAAAAANAISSRAITSWLTRTTTRVRHRLGSEPQLRVRRR